MTVMLLFVHLLDICVYPKCKTLLFVLDPVLGTRQTLPHEFFYPSYMKMLALIHQQKHVVVWQLRWSFC